MTERFEQSHKEEPDSNQIKVFGEELMVRVAGNEAPRETADKLFDAIEAVCSGVEGSFLYGDGRRFRLISREVGQSEMLAFHTNPNRVHVLGYSEMERAAVSVNWLKRGTILALTPPMTPPRIEYEVREGMYIDHESRLARVERGVYSVRTYSEQYIANRSATNMEVEAALQIIAEAVAFDAAMGQHSRSETQPQY